MRAPWEKVETVLALYHRQHENGIEDVLRTQNGGKGHAVHRR